MNKDVDQTIWIIISSIPIRNIPRDSHETNHYNIMPLFKRIRQHFMH
jgi:hypothetical protein